LIESLYFKGLIFYFNIVDNKVNVEIKNNFIKTMAKSKGTRILVTLECTECNTNINKRAAGVNRYATKKNRRNNPNRLELKKFCPHCNSHTLHKETK